VFDYILAPRFGAEMDRDMSSKKPVEISYFGIQAFTGTTKHMGGMRSTVELIDNCRIREGMHVLDVGCGVGATASYLVQDRGCTVVGVDITPGMVERSSERAHREGFEDRAEFKVGDAHDLPLESDTFDAVICESVMTFVEDKQTAINELVRVTKPGGRVGFNEETWLKTPVPQEMIEYSHNTWEIEHEVPMREDWEAMMAAGGLMDITVHIHHFDTARESTQMKRYRGRDMWLMMIRSFSLFLTSAEFRSYMKQRRGLPKGLFDYLGYGLFVGRKQD
jgi:ubiquinone/menaquinone biosynthesis C-methylase UbiE